MTNNWDMADWYAAGALAPNGDFVEKRTAARAALIKKNPSEGLRASALIFANAKPLSDEDAAPVLSALKNDATYSRLSGEQDLRVFAAATIDGTNSVYPAAIAARLVVMSSSLGGRRSFAKLDHLVASSREKLESAAVSLRAEPAARKPLLVPEIDDASLAGEHAATGLPKAIQTLRTALFDLGAGLSQVEQAAAVRDRNSAERMELLLLLQTGELGDGQPLSKLAPIPAAIGLGRDLARAFQAPVAMSTLDRIGKACLQKAGIDPEQQVRWIEVFAIGVSSTATNLPLPLTRVLSESPERRRDVLNETFGIEIVAEGSVTLRELLRQSALEGHAEKAWARA